MYFIKFLSVCGVLLEKARLKKVPHRETRFLNNLFYFPAIVFLFYVFLPLISLFLDAICYKKLNKFFSIIIHNVISYDFINVGEICLTLFLRPR